MILVLVPLLVYCCTYDIDAWWSSDAVAVMHRTSICMYPHFDEYWRCIVCSSKRQYIIMPATKYGNRISCVVLDWYSYRPCPMGTILFQLRFGKDGDDVCFVSVSARCEEDAMRWACVAAEHPRGWRQQARQLFFGDYFYVPFHLHTTLGLLRPTIVEEAAYAATDRNSLCRRSLVIATTQVL